MKCKYCNGTGEEPKQCPQCGTPLIPEEPIEEKPEVVTVRVIRGSGKGRVYHVIQDKNSSLWQRVEGYFWIDKINTEIIPKYDHSKYRLMARDELVQKGDKSYYEGKWHNAGFASCPYIQDDTVIYIRPLPQQEERDEAHDRAICEQIVTSEGQCEQLDQPCYSCLLGDLCYSETTDGEVQRAAENWLTAHPKEPEDGCLPRYEIKYGKFGAYFFDRDYNHDLTLEQVLSILVKRQTHPQEGE